MRALLGTDRLVPRWLAVVWVGVAGWVMGTMVLAEFLRERIVVAFLGVAPEVALRGPIWLGLVPGVLSVLAAIVGVRRRDLGGAIGRTIGASTVVSLACPPLTWMVTVANPFETLLGVTMVGAFMAAPLGIVFGTIYAIPIAVQARLRARPSLGSLDLALMVLGAGWVALGTLTLRLAADEHRPLLWLPTGTAIAGAGVFALGAARTLLKLALAHVAGRGALRAWEVVPAAQIERAHEVPRLFPLGRADAVLVRRVAHAGGPFRSNERLVPIARVAS